MASANRKESVIISSTDGDTISSQLGICGIKVVGGAGGATINLKAGTTIIYSCTVGNSAEKFEEVHMRIGSAGLTVNIASGSGTIYIYTK
jgi:hypothetical protein